jgi:hypothetical protein
LFTVPSRGINNRPTSTKENIAGVMICFFNLEMVSFTLKYIWKF